MINISDLTENDIGRMVIHDPGYKEPEVGILKTWNQKYIFVVYPGGNIEKAIEWKRYTAAATNPDYLSWGR